MRGCNLPLLLFSLIYYSTIILLAGYLNIWEDELYSLNTSSKTLSYAIHQSINFEVQPPVYFILLTIWRSFSDSILWARLFSILVIIISQFLLYKFTKKLSDRRIATVISVLFLLNPTIVFTILEIRLFSMVILLSLIIIIVFFNSYYKENPDPVNRMVFIIVSVAGIFTQYYIGFLIFAVGMILLLQKKKRTFLLFVVDMIIPLILIILYLPHIRTSIEIQTSVIPSYSMSPKIFLSEVKTLLSVVTFGFFSPLDTVNIKLLKWAGKLGIIIFILASLDYKKLKKEIQTFLPYLAISFILILFFIAVLCLFGQYSIEYKYTLVLFIPVSITLLLLIISAKPRFLIFWLIIFALIYLSDDYSKYQELYKVKDYRALSNYLESHEEKEVPVFVFRNISAENMSLYYKDIKKLIPLPNSFEFDKDFSPDQWKITDRDTNQLKGNFLNYPKIYLVIDDTPLQGYSESKEILMNVLNEYFIIIDTKTFKKELFLYKFSKKHT